MMAMIAPFVASSMAVVMTFMPVARFMMPPIFMVVMVIAIMPFIATPSQIGTIRVVSGIIGVGSVVVIRVG